MTTFAVETIEPQPAAVVRAEVPMVELRTVFDRGFVEVMRVRRHRASPSAGRRSGSTHGCRPTPSRSRWGFL